MRGIRKQKDKIVITFLLAQKKINVHVEKIGFSAS